MLAQDPLRIVAIGGGTGLSTLLNGLKRHVYLPGRPGAPDVAGAAPLVDLTAVVTVTDDGGSSGRLRRDLDVLPPGDIRNCMVALSEDEALLSRLFQYRFPAGRGLKGHTFGNLFLAAMTHLTGDFPHAVRLAAEVLATRGRILASSDGHVTLEARLEDGSTVAGETKISKSRSRIASISLHPRPCRPLKETLEAIARADLITLGPGSLYTSVIPNLLVDQIPQAIRRSPALKAYFVNLMWQPGETMRFTAADHVEAIYRHGGTGLLDCVVVNTHPVGRPLRRRYAEQSARPVENDIERLAQLRVTVVGRDLLARSDWARHDPEAAATVAIELARAGRRRRVKLLREAR
ncbi:MAG: uridine diphosphate-N-acetylglucosamine-binding protein YvcK [Acidobacteria bacterium]|nr:uridine diphosphate-N-acetylglucosamine-binding protein YvcK [Acidobacteriota bacterium]